MGLTDEWIPQNGTEAHTQCQEKEPRTKKAEGFPRASWPEIRANTGFSGCPVSLVQISYLMDAIQVLQS